MNASDRYNPRHCLIDDSVVWTGQIIANKETREWGYLTHANVVAFAFKCKWAFIVQMEMVCV